MKLILCEKPAVAREFADALGANFTDGYHKGNDYIITNGIGHLVTLCMPEDYNEALKAWSIDRLPIVPKEFKLKAIEEGYIKKQINIVKKAFSDNNIDTVIIAGDPGREGELIARNILKFIGQLNGNYTYLRFWTSEALTKEVILSNIRKCKPLSEYDDLFQKGEVRSHMDWLVGMNYTRLFSCSFKVFVSFGRVQTCLLKRQYDLNKKIKGFSESKYYSNTFVIADKYRFTCLLAEQKDEDLSEADKKMLAETIHATLIGNATVSKITRKTVSVPPPKLYDLTELQKICNKKYGFSAKKTLEIAQTLYENKKVLSYPRTPSRCLSESDYDFFCGCLSKIGISGNPDPQNKNIFNSKEVEDHHALLILNTADNLTDDEQKVYDLVLASMKRVLQDNYVYDQYTSEIPIGERLFKNTSKIEKEKGWKALNDTDTEEKESDDEEQLLDAFDLNEGESYPIQNPEIKEIKTKPPQYDSESSLLAWMKKYNLGTPATRSGLVEILLSDKRGYCLRDKKKILITDKGIAFIDALLKNDKVAPLLDKENTKSFEEGIEKSPDKLIPEFISQFKEVKDFYLRNGDINLSGIQTSKTFTCPICGGTIKKSKFGWYCSGKTEGEKCLSLPAEFCGAKLTEDDVEKILGGKRSGVKKMTSKAGKSFSGKLFLDKDERKLKIDFV